MIALTLMTSLLAADPAPLSLSVSELQVVELPKSRGAFFAEHLALKLADTGARVSSAAQLAQVLGAERQKQLLGCSDDSGSCLAEIASALGNDGLVFGEVAKLGAVLQVNLKVIGGGNGQLLASYSGRTDAEEKVLDLLEEAAWSLARDTAVKLGRTPVPPREVKAPGLRPAAWVPLALGGALTVAGTVSLVLARSTWSSIPQTAGATPLPVDEARARASAGQTQQTVGWILVGAGAAAVTTGTVLWLLGRSGDAPSSTRVAAIPSADGFTVSLGGSF